MGNTPTASSRTTEPRASSTPERSLRHRSLIEQLENDHLDVRERRDANERAYAMGWNMAVEFQARWVRGGGTRLAPQLSIVSDDTGTDEQRAYSRGRNAGVRHIQDLLRVEAGLTELAHAPVIVTTELYTAPAEHLELLDVELLPPGSDADLRVRIKPSAVTRDDRRGSAPELDVEHRLHHAFDVGGES